ncbi:MAG TPA: deoxyribose-phosphate aldolase [Gemmatimonadales bacterium]|nr:deoxyribose-phosphate aldolase [Gemmatimonadales bacterium]
MNDSELDQLAAEVVRRVLRGAHGAAGATRGAAAVAQGGTARPLEDVSWRGPQVQLAAWTPAAGPRRVADFVDHTLLKAEATRADILKLCAEAREHRFAAVCVNPAWVELCAGELAGTSVAVASVCGFPLGATTPETKAAEAAEAVSHGAAEVDMVAAIGHIKGGEWRYVEDDIRAVVEACGRRGGGALVKVIIESAALTPEDIVKASAVARLAGAHFVKTSTGFHPAGGATTDAVRLMRLTVGDDLGVKAAGGVRDCATALAMIAAGASRIGTSSGVSFVGCLGPAPLPLAELLKQPQAHAASCRSGTCAAPAGGQPY